MSSEKNKIAFAASTTDIENVAALSGRRTRTCSERIRRRVVLISDDMKTL